MQLRLPGIAVQLFARVFSAGEINGNCRKILLIKNSGATIKSVAPVSCFSSASSTAARSSVCFIALLPSSVDAAAHSPALRKTFTPYPLNILFKRRGQRHCHRDFHHINGVTVFPGHTLHDMPSAIFQLLNKRAGNTTVSHHKHAVATFQG